MNPMPDNVLTRRVLDCAEEVHREVGPGLEADAYKTCLAMELTKAGIPFERHCLLKPSYRGHPLELEYRMDFVIADTLVVEVEAVEEIGEIHEQRLRTYVHFGPFPMGILLNFNTVDFDDGILGIPGIPVDVLNAPPDGVDVFDDPGRWFGQSPAGG
ncbi:MAG: GxxExxY protein [Acetobacteraceae bacterium]|nr:GxxExxY protein [Acetobacteraceae bacterium]